MLQKILTALVIVFLIEIQNNAQGQPYNPAAANLRIDIETLSADSLRGRFTGTQGCHKAAQYIAQQMQQLGLKPLPADTLAHANPYMLPYQLEQITWQQPSLRIKNRDLYPGTDFVALGSFAPNCGTINEVVFAGFGLDTDAYNDYLSANVVNRGAVVLPGAPRLANGSFFMGQQGQALSHSLPHRINAAKHNGAKALFYAAFDTDAQLQNWANTTSTHQHHYYRMLGADDGFPVIVISVETAAQMLRTTTQNLQKINKPYTPPQQTKKQKKTAITVPISGYRFDGRLQIDTLKTHNVAGWLSAASPSNEYIILSAHYDHLGVDTATQKVFNGADDNASGTAAIIEVARRLKKRSLKRNVIFLAVSGEEIGLFGSTHFCSNLPVEAKNIVADVNIDMVGRHDTLTGQGHYLYSIGSKAIDVPLDSLAQSVADTLQLLYTLDGPEHPLRLMYRSDHYSFVKKGIPAIFLFGGFHADYHTVNDVAAKINYPLMLSRVAFAERLTLKLATTPQRIDAGFNRNTAKQGGF